MGKLRKQYKKPMVEKVNLRVTESVLAYCKTEVSMSQPGGSNRTCTAGGPGACKTTAGS